ncbi:helix-turn-helix transcriptional regulator [Alkalihalobacillus sp. CinArs1]|uniref:helix-turn-helix transcriptional regulator n=1 Tax=Alkalihalobacillus sp. CinArs1 TaxID=2995314 RepID=UPI0022DE361E|nr:helix-turn-helix transcriptional regulator [Alkalihalobacillus sp. CinArs1]
MLVENRIKEVRRQLNVSQLDLAEEIQVTKRTIIAFEENKYHPSLELALKISTYLNTSVEELFQFDESKQKEKKKSKAVPFTLIAIVVLFFIAYFTGSLDYFAPILAGLVGSLIGIGISNYKSKQEKPKHPSRDERVDARVSKFTTIFLTVAIGIFTINGITLDYLGHETISVLFFFQFMMAAIILLAIGSNIAGRM